MSLDSGEKMDRLDKEQITAKSFTAKFEAN
jgi:hypothetical protein